MAEIPLLLTVEAGRCETSRSRSVVSFLTATLLQLLAGATVFVIPLLVIQTLPGPHKRPVTYVVAVTPPPPPPGSSEPKYLERNRIRIVSPQVSLSHWLLAPVDIPDGILEEIGNELNGPAGIEGGIPEGRWTEILGELPPLREEPAAPVRPGGDIKLPRKVKHVEPIYPDIARKARIEGIVVLEAVIDPSGGVSDLRVLRSVPLLDDAALSAVTQWHYEPTLLNGVPVPIVMTVTVRFDLEKR